MSYGAAHRALLRAAACAGVLPCARAEQLAHAHARPDDQTSVQDMVKLINEEIRPLKQTIKITTDELADESVLVFLSLGYDEATKSQNVFSASELELFRILLEQIATTERREISGIAALNLVSGVKGSLTKHDAEKLLKTWCAMRYLDKTEGGYILGLRAIHELEGYIRQNLPDSIEECSLCKQVVFRGCNCTVCGLAVHTRCLNRYLEKVEKWPCCKAEYTGLAELSDTVYLPRTQQSTVYEPEQMTSQETIEQSQESLTQSIETMDDIEMTQASQLGISQTSDVRKRKRQREY